MCGGCCLDHAISASISCGTDQQTGVTVGHDANRSKWSSRSVTTSNKNERSNRSKTLARYSTKLATHPTAMPCKNRVTAIKHSTKQDAGSAAIVRGTKQKIVTAADCSAKKGTVVSHVHEHIVDHEYHSCECKDDGDDDGVRRGFGCVQQMFECASWIDSQAPT